VNLLLEVTGRRADGYHEIRTVLQTLELADTVSLGFEGPPGVTVSGPFAAGTPPRATNLAWRAAEALAAATGHELGCLSLALEKRIPPAGGLGGGSSDAATTLRLLQRAWPGITEAELAAAAAAVGSDESFFLLGGTALATGRGDVVRALPPLPRHGVVLFVPPATLDHKTARMFAALDRLPFDDRAVVSAFLERPPRQFGSAAVFNAFERVAFDLFPGLAGLWQALEERVGEPVRLAGAGPTLFWIGPPHDAGRVAAAAEGLPCTVIASATAPSQWAR
jgi:4-diphosphocytidyl-2-C-methyl-D-erythritol kinase